MNSLKHIFLNVYSAYAISFCTAFLLYCLNFSDGYPELSNQLKSFILLSSGIAFSIGCIFCRKKRCCYREIPFDEPFLRRGILFIYCAYALQCAHAGYVPVVNALRGYDFDYMNFGIKYFKVLVAAFLSFYMIYSFHSFLSLNGIPKKRIRAFCYVALAFFVPIVIMSRAMFMFNFVACGYLVYIKHRLTLRSVLIAIMIAMLTLWGFGVLGNVRSLDSGGSDLIEDIAKPSQEFYDLGLSTTYLWAYVYSTCSLANLQEITEYCLPTEQSYKRFFIYDFLPQTFSKLLVDFSEDSESFESLRIDPRLTTATVYREPFFYAGKLGVWINFLFLMVIPMLYITFIPETSSFYLTGMANMLLMNLFSSFSNILVMPAYCFVFFFVWFFSNRYNRECCFNEEV